MKRLSSLAAFFTALVVCALPATALAEAPQPPSMTVEDLRLRLNLTPEQQSQIQPHLDTRKARMEAVKGKMGDTSSRSDKRAAMKEAKDAQDDFVKNVEPILTPEQQAEWKKMRDEGREQLKERWRNRSE